MKVEDKPTSKLCVKASFKWDRTFSALPKESRILDIPAGTPVVKVRDSFFVDSKVVSDSALRFDFEYHGCRVAEENVCPLK